MIAALIPAGGKSRRMGFAKLLLEVEGKSLLAGTVEMAASASPSVMVVVGAYADAYAPVAEAAGAEVVRNPEWREGLAASLRAGISALPAQVEAALIVLPDQPFVDTSHLLALVQVFRDQKHSLVLSAYCGILGAPAVVGRELFPQLLKLTGESGAKALLGSVSSVGEVALEKPFDVDTVEQAERLLSGGLGT